MTTTTGATTAPTIGAMDIIAGLILEDGRPWGRAAYPWQLEDARAVLSSDGPRLHYLLRGRGMSKTSDVAGVALGLLLTEAPARSRSFIYASDQDQAGIFMDALAGFVERTPGLSGALELGARSVTVRATGARLTVESSDGASAFGTRPWLVVADELSLWPSTSNYRRLWSAIISALPKVQGSRLVVITTAGSPTGLGAEVWAEAEQSSHWHTARRPGPSPWWTDEDVEALKSSLTASEWRRLIECVWAESDDALTSPEDIDAAVRAGVSTLPPRPGVEYVIGLDIGVRRDLTALAVAHVETRDAGRVVIVDRVMSWRPEPGQRVDLAEVEAAALRVCKQYNNAKLRFDRSQAEQLVSNLIRAGVKPEEYVFSSAGASKLARALAVALRDRALELPDDEETRSQFLTTRLVETGPGVIKLQNPRGTHDDIPTAVGMTVVDLMARPEVGKGSVTVPRGRRSKRDFSVISPRAVGGAGAGAGGSAIRPGPMPGRGAARSLLTGPRVQRQGWSGR